jgi:tetratricopeptide (TPR) repeat protein
MFRSQIDSCNSNLRPLRGTVDRCLAKGFVAVLIFGGVLCAQQPAAQQPYSIGVPSFDEVPVDAIPPAPPPVKRAPPKPAPAAKSPEEQAAFDKIVKEQRPDERIKLVEDFLLSHPDSEFKQAVYMAASQAYRRKNDLARMLTYAELTLAENPENLQALLILAESLPESVRREDPDYVDRVEEAREHAQLAIELIGKTARPQGATPEQWQQSRKQVESAARLALALTAMMREDYAEAVAEYDKAFKLMDKPDALSLYRLGLTYSFLKKYDEAIEALQKSAEAGGVNSRTASGTPRDLVAEARAYVEKQKASSAPGSEQATGESAGTQSNEPAVQ